MAQRTVWPDELFLDLDRTGPVPLYFQLSSRLEQAIRSGAIAPGDRLENEIAIGERLNLSRPTVRRAIQELVDKGMLVRRRGVGTQVVQSHVTRQVELTSLYEDLQSSARLPTTDVLARETIPASTVVAEQLRIPEGSPVVHLRRLRRTNDVPVAVMENFLPIEFEDITTTQLLSRGLYEIMRARGVAIRIANQRIGARSAREDEPRLLEIENAGPVLTMERVAFDLTGRAVEYGQHCYRPDLYSFETTLIAK